MVRDTDAYRVVHGEGDRLPALIVDRYGDYLVIQTLDQGMDAAKDWIVSALVDLFAPRGIIARNDAAVRTHEELPLETGVVFGEAPAELTVHMNGLAFHADLLRGQKTGIFLDQRENYAAAARYAHGKALDCFTSTGGFALHLAAKCESVEAVDSSAAGAGHGGIEPRRQRDRQRRIPRSRRLRNSGRLLLRAARVLDGGARSAGFRQIPPQPRRRRPRLQRNQPARPAPARAGRDSGDAAPARITSAKPCCSKLSPKPRSTAGRELRVLERRTQAQDHPILLTVPETHYLKCLILQVL